MIFHVEFVDTADLRRYVVVEVVEDRYAGGSSVIESDLKKSAHPMRWLSLNWLLLLALLWISFILVFRSSFKAHQEDQEVVMAALQPLKYLTVAARAKHTATVIYLHVSHARRIGTRIIDIVQGLGDSGHGWQPVATMFGSDPALKHVKWILPHAWVTSCGSRYTTLI